MQYSYFPGNIFPNDPLLQRLYSKFKLPSALILIDHTIFFIYSRINEAYFISKLTNLISFSENQTFKQINEPSGQQAAPDLLTS